MKMMMKYALGVHGPSFFWVRAINVLDFQKPCYFQAVVVRFSHKGMSFSGITGASMPTCVLVYSWLTVAGDARFDARLMIPYKNSVGHAMDAP